MISHPDRISSYFLSEWKSLLLVTVSGIIYNAGSLITVWLEGQLVSSLVSILSGAGTIKSMLIPVILYLFVTLIIQGSRFIKRFSVRHFANNINREMKCILYSNLLRKSRSSLEEEGAGELLTKAISDTDDTAEGMRKFTTEIFDTGILIVSYVIMLFIYDWKLSLISLAFTPPVYIISSLLKKNIQKAGEKYKKASGHLRDQTLSLVDNAVTYRIYGVEDVNRKNYEKTLSEYEKAAISSDIWLSALSPLYKALSGAGIILIFIFGGRNVLNMGWKVWDIAAFTTYVSAFTKLSVKSSKAAKLFNSLEKASVSWKRIKPMMKNPPHENKTEIRKVEDIAIKNLSVSIRNKVIFKNINLFVHPGEIIGVTGPVACGKSTFGKVFLSEFPYSGSIKFGGKEVSAMSENETASIFGYLGHDPELFSGSVRDNILCGSDGDALLYLKAVDMKDEALAMDKGIDTDIGSYGLRLSGGQRQRLALARTLSHPHPVLILDDPFSALDRTTEDKIFSSLRKYGKDRIIFLISHRLCNFPFVDRILFIGSNGLSYTGTHDELISFLPEYSKLWKEQRGGSEK